MSETQVVSGTVTQLLHPGDEQHYLIEEYFAAQLKDGYSLAVIQTGEAQFPNTIPGIWVVAPFISRLLKDPSQWAERVIVDNPDFEEGDEVTITVAEQVVSKETELVATTAGGVGSDE